MNSKNSVDILCVGNVVVDAIGYPIDELPPEGSMRVFDKVELGIGGCPTNTAVALARLGLRVGLMAKIAPDGLGEFVKQTLRANKVDLRGLIVSKDPREATSYSFIMIPSSGDRRILHTFGCNATLQASDMDTRLFRGPKWIAFEALGIIPKLKGRDLAGLLRAAKKAGARTAGDTALNDRLKDWSPVFAGCWEFLDVFFPSEEEAERITRRKKPREICQFFRDKGVKIAGVKLGARGSAILTDDGYEEIPAYKVKCVDTLGAGDSFMAGLLAGLLKGLHPHAAARLGNGVAAHCVSAVGSSAGIPTLAKVEHWMKRR